MNLIRTLSVLGSVLIPFSVVALMQVTTHEMVIGYMAVMAVLYILLLRKIGADWLWPRLIASFFFGFVSDLAINLYSRYIGTGIRSKQLVHYFNTTGNLMAAMYAGLLTFWLIIGTYGIGMFILEIPNSMRGWYVIVGFLFGALTGQLVQYSPALKNLLPFYLSTSGDLENRAWDGASVAFVMFLLNEIRSN